MRAHNLLYALGGALAVPTVPTASRYVATGDERRLGELAVRGSRYTLALFVPLCVTLMVLSKPIIGVWLGDRYTDGAAALTILVSYWLLYGALIVTPGFLVGAGEARVAGRTLACAAVLNLVLALILTPELGVEGPAVATAGALAAAFPLLLRAGLRASGVLLADLLRARPRSRPTRSARSWPARSLGDQASASSPRRCRSWRVSAIAGVRALLGRLLRARARPRASASWRAACCGRRPLEVARAAR